MSNICVLGMGYIGLPTALMFAAHGTEVVGVDISLTLLKQLNDGSLPFTEDGLEELFNQALSNHICFQSKCPETSLYIVAVPTPFSNDTKKIDPSFIITAINNILDVCLKDSIIIVESTVSPGTIDRYIRPAIEKRGFTIGVDVHISHAPERIIPGKMIKELRENARVIGADTQEVAELVRDLYATFCVGEMVMTDIRTAEMTKVVENTYRDVNIAFANELAKICRQDNLDVYEIIKIANMHPRVDILQPGPGVGGHCISVDPWFLVGDYPRLSLLIHEARKINESMPTFVLHRIRDIITENNLTRNINVGFYGIAYKEDVDDVRESPTMQLYEQLNLHLSGNNISFYDPLCSNGILSEQATDFSDFIHKSDIVVIMVGHSHIKENMHLLRGKIVLDTKNICNLSGCYKL